MFSSFTGFRLPQDPRVPGLDEITLAGSDPCRRNSRHGKVCEITHDARLLLSSPAHNGPNPYAAATPGNAAPGFNNDSARILTAILANQFQGPPREIVLANTAAVLRVAGRAASWKEGLRLAADAIPPGPQGVSWNSC